VADIEVEGWDAGVDYLRLTHAKNGESYDVVNRYARAVEQIARRVAPPGTRAEHWNWMGYRGERLHNVAWGQHDAGFIFQATGLAAREASLLELPYTNCPRLDVQATFWLTADDEGLASRVDEVVTRFKSGKKGRPVSNRLVSTHGDGDTAYIGTRGKKSKFLRCYDKWRESKFNEGYRHAWRYEAELTDQHAVLCKHALEVLPKTSDAVLSVVSGFFGQRGVALPETGNRTAIDPSALPPDEGSDERRLRWLNTQVRPTLERLISHGVPYWKVLEALGLDQPPRRRF